MRKPFKRMISAVMTIVVIALSIITAFAVEYDPVQNKSYSYSEKGDCTVNNSGVVWVSSNYTYTHRYTVNGKIATCSWSTNNSPDDGTYTNATKYYLNNGSLRAKAFYWLYLDNDASISDNRAKYDSSSKTYWDDICNALDDAGATGAYAFVHSVIDYMQQGSLNPYCDDDWNDVVVDFIDHIDYYPDVPKEYRIFYFYPQGNAAQSLMSWENTPHGYIKVVKASSDTLISNGNSNYSFKDIEYYVSKSKTDFDTSGNNYIGYIKLNATGEGHSKDGSRETLRFLPPDTYYIKEGYIPNGNGYKRNNTVYTVTVTKDHTTTAPLVLRVSDEPKTCYGKIVKISTKPELTNNNSDYSFAGIRYSFSKSNTDFSPQGTNYIGYVELDENGVGYTANGSRATLRDLVPGTYYVKESVLPSGCKYKLDSTVYTMTFTFNNDENHLAVLNVKDEPEGSSSARVVKKSSLPDITNGNSLYSFEGAEFKIYRSESDAEQNSNPYTTITTDENGVALVSDIDLGTYYVKETKAPDNFELSDEIKELKIESAQEEAYEVEFEDKPVVTSVSVLLQKKNAVTGETSQTNMSDAEYSFCYYDGFFDEDQVRDTAPTRTWVLMTDEDNLCKYDIEHLVSGDDLYEDENGEFVIPLGTLTIQETEAPEGFYLDETIYHRQLTKDSADDVTQYNIPVSNEFEIPRVSLSGEKIWDDDDNRDGKRPENITVELYREDELIDTKTVSAATDWKYEFTDLPKGYADLSFDDHIYFYHYEVKETAVENYTSDSTGVDADPDEDNHLICDFTNHYTPEQVPISGKKTWDDYDNIMGCSPESIKVILFRDGEKIDETVSTEADNWSYSFPNQYKYHDGGIKYQYTIGEEPVSGYTDKVDGFNLKNSLGSGSIRLHKTDESGTPMESVVFTLYTENDLPVSFITNGEYFKFWELTENDEDAEYTTNADGEIFIDELPYGKYYFEETKTLMGFIPYGEKIWFEISGDSEDTQNVTVEAENARMVMPNTGGSGTRCIYLISITLAGAALAMICTYYKKRKDFCYD